MNPKKQFGIRIDHAGIHVSNFERTYQWYHEIFGFERIPEQNTSPFEGGVFPKMTWIRLGDFFLEVYEVQDAQPYNLVDLEWTLGVKHLNFLVDDLAGFLEYIRSRDDVNILVDNTYTETDGAVYLTDPDGILVEVTMRKE
ncbi:MAG: VOC family protein [Clostridiales bacterium]|nr:VOC family protein [Clostridiales bacterium]